MSESSGARGRLLNLVLRKPVNKTSVCEQKSFDGPSRVPFLAAPRAETPDYYSGESFVLHVWVNLRQRNPSAAFGGRRCRIREDLHAPARV